MTTEIRELYTQVCAIQFAIEAAINEETDRKILTVLEGAHFHVTQAAELMHEEANRGGSEEQQRDETVAQALRVYGDESS